MWILQRFFFVVALALMLVLWSLNATEEVRVQYWFGDANVIDNSPLPLVMVTFFLFGVLFYYLFSIAREWRLRAEIRRLRRQSENKDRELRDLRNLPLDELSDTGSGYDAGLRLP
ncbi:LapA family protein [bacterium]|nr:LapA family protein [bacterium]